MTRSFVIRGASRLLCLTASLSILRHRRTPRGGAAGRHESVGLELSGVGVDLDSGRIERPDSVLQPSGGVFM